MRTKNNELKKSMEAYADNYKGYYAHYLNKYGLRARYTDFSKLAIGVARVIKIAFLKGAKWHEQYSVQRNWINVKDKLPEFGKDVLVIEDGSVKVAQYCKQFMSSRTYWTTDYGRLITHWMPIPELPKGGEK